MTENKETQNKRPNEANKRDEPERGTQGKPRGEIPAVDSTDVSATTVKGVGRETDAEEKE